MIDTKKAVNGKDATNGSSWAKSSISSSPVPDMVRMGEMSTIGLRVIDGRIYEDIDDNFRGYNLIHTCDEMSRDATIYAAINAIKNLIRRVDWYVDTPNAKGKKTEAMRKREKFIESCMHDMSHSWSDFVNEALSMMIYGYSLHEKVYKVRRGYEGGHKYKSKFNDGMIGWAKLPVRSQATVYKWIYDSKMRDVQYVRQEMSYALGGSGAAAEFPSRIDIPYSKLLHFKFDSTRGNPEGNTPLKACYVSWKYKTTIAEYEAIGVSRDMSGLPVISIPPEYMSADASADKVAVYEYMQDVINNIHMNEQAGLVFPRFIDPETKQDLFDFKLVSAEGNKQFDTGKIIDRYESKILMAFLADVLKMGQDSSGSFALSDNKTNLLAVGIESILTQLTEVINRDLVTQTARLNGWDLSKPLPEIRFEDLDERDLDKLGAFVQRTVQVGAMEVDEALSHELRRIAKLPMIDEDKKIRKELLNAANQGEGGSSSAGTSARNVANRVSAGKQSGVSN